MSFHQTDLLLWCDNSEAKIRWPDGQVCYLGHGLESAKVLDAWVQESRADYLLLWRPERVLPDTRLLSHLIEDGVDLAHCGLKQGMGDLWPSLSLVALDWSMINGPIDKPSTSWRLRLDACLIRRDLILRLGGLDVAFSSVTGAGLELGFRYLNKGALIEYRPELLPDEAESKSSEPPLEDLYVFLLRHHKPHWSRYVALRRTLGKRSWVVERRALSKARALCAALPVTKGANETVWYSDSSYDHDQLNKISVSAIIPTLGRYAYLPGALASLSRQTIKPREVIVVDQNPPELRRPEVYEACVGLNLKIIWQDQQGQSLARNTGLAEATSPYVFLFDDDSIANDDLIETHLRAAVGSRFQVSTGVSHSPSPHDCQLPVSFRYPRIAQTFDTGNSLLPLTLARQLGGLDRNYDFGPGTDVDFGTRLYLSGVRILHNPKAVRIHFKAPMGGLRTHGAHRYNTDRGLFDAFPPITQSYYGLCYLSKSQQRERLLLQFVTGKLPQGLRVDEFLRMRNVLAALRVCLGLLLLPFKWSRSLKGAQALVKSGSRLGLFEVPQRSE
jgi:hypothetical protein